MRSEQQVSGMLCPVCRTGLALSDRGGVEIDYCPSCRGVWLDRGELDKIIERTPISDNDRSAPGRQYDRAKPGGLMGMAAAMLEGDDGYRKDRPRHGDSREAYEKRKRKSFLSEFFD
ncbi:hypothetical protein A3736_08565 [Erythrobacter sp. HI0063]|jgi:uncharacterized protein|uniref:TFIIB-type zinc ribbon-containing protein n=1 Tax=Erythrobacter sp. HI0063 TaxID=1822240 RepID=UPI0007C2AAF6|nr:zf-TFIIB domain-containing protein [Erythrobacter sp. HI0063]KZY56315.1 hypothetical protein A3736_08565 [Erythrobacter sp. HI0063]